MAKIDVFGMLNAATASGVLADAKQIAGGYMVLTTAERTSLKTGLLADGMRVYDSDEKLEYRWNANTSAWDVIPSGGAQPENFLVSAKKSDDGKTLSLTTNKGEVVEFQGGGNIFEEITEVPETPSSQVIYIYNHNHELVNVELQVPFNFTTYAKSEAVNIRWNEDYTKLLATIGGAERELTMSGLKELYEGVMSPYVFVEKDVSEPEAEYQIPLFYKSESIEMFDVGFFSYEDASESLKRGTTFAHNESDIKVTSISLYQYYNNEFQPLLINIDYEKATNKPTLNGINIEGEHSSEYYGLFRTKTLYDIGELGDQNVLALVKENGVVTSLNINNIAYTQYGIDHSLELQGEDNKYYFTYILNGETITLQGDEVVNDFIGDRNYFTYDISEDNKLFLLDTESDITFKIDEVMYSGQSDISYILLNINEADPEVKIAETIGAYVTNPDGELQELQLTKNLPLKYSEVSITITFDLTHLICDLGTEIKVSPGESIVGNLIADEGYALPSNITFSSSITNYNYDSESGTLSFEVPYVDSSIIAEAKYGIRTNISNGTIELKSEYIEKGTIVTGVITGNEHYTAPLNINVNNCSYTYSGTTGIIKLYNPTEIVSVTASCVPDKYNITKNLENFTSDDIPDTISYGEIIKCNLKVSSSYAFPDEIEVTGCTYTYNSTTGALTLSNPEDNITITASAVPNGLKFIAQNAGTKVYLTIDRMKYIDDTTFTIAEGNLTDSITLYYSLDDGATWNTFFSGTTGTSEIVTLENVGDSVLIYGNNSTFGTYNATATKRYSFPAFKVTDGTVRVEGKVSGLVRGTTYITSNYMFCGLFHDNTNIISAPELNMKYYERDEARYGNYANAFLNCTKLINGPKVIPEQYVCSYDFFRTFYNCNSMIKPPLMNNIQPDGVYSKTIEYTFCECFAGCSSLNITTDSSKGTKFFTAYTITGQSVDKNYKYMFNGVGGSVPATPSIDVPYYYE